MKARSRVAVAGSLSIALVAAFMGGISGASAGVTGSRYHPKAGKESVELLTKIQEDAALRKSFCSSDIQREFIKTAIETAVIEVFRLEQADEKREALDLIIRGEKAEVTLRELAREYVSKRDLHKHLAKWERQNPGASGGERHTKWAQLIDESSEVYALAEKKLSEVFNEAAKAQGLGEGEDGVSAMGGKIYYRALQWNEDGKNLSSWVGVDFDRSSSPMPFVVVINRGVPAEKAYTLMNDIYDIYIEETDDLNGDLTKRVMVNFLRQKYLAL